MTFTTGLAIGLLISALNGILCYRLGCARSNRRYEQLRQQRAPDMIRAKHEALKAGNAARSIFRHHQ